MRRYFGRRALRILPAYYLAAVVGIVLSAKATSDLLRGVPYFVFLDWLAPPLPPYSSVWWSLATEVQFYAVLPLLGILGRSTAGRLCGGTLLLLWMTGYLAFVGGMLVPRDVAAYEACLFGRAPLFLAGIAAAAVYRAYGGRIRQRLDRARVMRNGGSDLLLLLVVLGIAAFARCEQALGYRAPSAPHYQYRDLVTAALLAALLLLLVLAPLRLKRLLVNPLSQGIGVISYSVYLVHLPLTMFLLASRPFDHVVRAVADIPLQAFVRFIAIAVACVAVSTLTYWIVERPFLLRKARL